MIHKTFTGGRTLKGAKATLEYLLDTRVNDATAVLIEGSTKVTLAYIEQAARKQKWSWSSGVLSFEETLTDAQIAEVIKEWKRVTFPGMNPDQYDCLLVRHTDKNRTEIHYVIPRIECKTGLSLNPYFVKRDFIKKDLFQDYINLKMGFSQWQDNQFITKKSPAWSGSAKKENIKKAFDEALKPLVFEGIINNRTELIYQLSEWGYEVNRHGKEYISIIDKNGNNHRLKGSFYGEDFEYGVRGIEKKIARSKSTARDGTRRTVEEVGKQLDEIVKQQANSNRERFEGREKSTQEAGHLAQSVARGVEPGVSIPGERGQNNSTNHEKRPIEEAQRRIDDRARTETIERIGELRASKERRTRSSAARTKDYADAVITDIGTLEKGIGNRGRAKHRRTFTEVLKLFVDWLPDIIRQTVLDQIKKRHIKEKEFFKTVPVHIKEEEREPIREKEEEYQQPVIQSVLDHNTEDPFLPGDVGIKSIL